VIFIQFDEIGEGHWKCYLFGYIKRIETQSILKSGNDESNTEGVQPAIEEFLLWK
jgi:hypothetical protein